MNFGIMLKNITVSGVTEPEAPTEGLVGWYRFDGNVEDSSGNGNHGVIDESTVGYSYEDGPVDGKSILLDNGFIRIPGNFGEPEAITISGWFRLISVLGEYKPNKDIISVSDSVVWGINENADCIRWFYHSWWWEAREGDPYEPIQNGEWIHVAYVWDGPNTCIYIDGTPTAWPQYDTIIGYLGYNQTRLCGHQSANSWGTQQLSDIRIYNRALSPEEVQQLYELGNP